MRYLLLIGCALLSVGCSLPDQDRVLLGELKQLAEDHLGETLKRMVETSLQVAQAIIDSRVASPSIIEGMRAFIVRWRIEIKSMNELRLSELANDFFSASGREALSYEKGKIRLSQYSNGASVTIEENRVKTELERQTEFKDAAVQIMSKVSQATKQNERKLSKSFSDFVNANKSDTEAFLPFLLELRNY